MLVNKLDKDKNDRVKVIFTVPKNHNSLIKTVKDHGGEYVKSIPNDENEHIEKDILVYLPNESIQKVKTFWMQNCLT